MTKNKLWKDRTLRQGYASGIINAIVNGVILKNDTPEIAVKLAFKFADLMIKEEKNEQA